MKSKSTSLFVTITGLLLFVFVFANRISAQVPRPDHVVVCIMENHPYTGLVATNSIFGNASAPHINALAMDSGSANFTSSHAITHPSQPNYIAFFSGNLQGVTTDNKPGTYFTTANLARQLMDSGLTYIAYSEDLPYVGFDSDTNSYKRKHNPVTNWVGTGTNQVPAAMNQPFSAFPSPTGYDSLPTVSYVVPNQDNDMHNGSDPTRIAVGDTWMYNNMNAYIQWAKTHNSLFILTWDEDDGTSTTFDNRIVTIFAGEMVKTGQYSESIDHYTVLRTIEDMYHIGHAGQAASKSPIIDCWKAVVSGINEVGNTQPLWRVYPNPSSSELHITGNGKEASATEISITDVTGKLISHQFISDSKDITINTAAFSQGIYFYRVLGSAGNIQSGKFVVEHQ